MAGLFADRFDDVWMTVARTGDRVPAVQIEILVAVACVEPDAFAALSGDGHLLVSRELKLFLARGDVVQC